MARIVQPPHLPENPRHYILIFCIFPSPNTLTPSCSLACLPTFSPNASLSARWAGKNKPPRQDSKSTSNAISSLCSPDRPTWGDVWRRGASDREIRTPNSAQIHGLSSVPTLSSSRVEKFPRATSPTPQRRGPSCKSPQAKGIVQGEKEKTQAVFPSSPAGVSVQER